MRPPAADYGYRGDFQARPKRQFFIFKTNNLATNIRRHCRNFAPISSPLTTMGNHVPAARGFVRAHEARTQAE
jgi:hypothetical protein